MGVVYIYKGFHNHTGSANTVACFHGRTHAFMACLCFHNHPGSANTVARHKHSHMLQWVCAFCPQPLGASRITHGKAAKLEATVCGWMLRMSLWAMLTNRHESPHGFEPSLNSECRVLTARPSLTATTITKHFLTPPQDMDTLGVEPRACCMQSGCKTTTPCALYKSHC